MKRFLFALPVVFAGCLLVAGNAPGESRGKGSSIRVLGVGLAAEGGFITVYFTCTPREVQYIYQGSVSILDEKTGEVYNEIVVMPKVGPLIGRPKAEGQKGYVMVVNPGGRLKPGATVTVTIGKFTKKHLTVQGQETGPAAEAPGSRNR